MPEIKESMTCNCLCSYIEKERKQQGKLLGKIDALKVKLAELDMGCESSYKVSEQDKLEEDRLRQEFVNDVMDGSGGFVGYRLVM